MEPSLSGDKDVTVEAPSGLGIGAGPVVSFLVTVLTSASCWVREIMIDVSCLPSSDNSPQRSSWYRSGAFRFAPTRRLVPCRLDLAAGQSRNREIVAVDSNDSRVVID
jgi:hypothetical protein